MARTTNPKKATTKAKSATSRSSGAATKKSAKKAPAKETAAKKAPAKKAPAKKAKAKKATAKKPAPKKRSNKGVFTKKFLDTQRKALVEERARYVHSADSLKAEADAMIEAREPGDVQFDEESGEGDTLAVERERDLALSAQARAAVDEIDAALARLDDGSYGICVISGDPIPKERLEAIPWASVTVQNKAGGFGLR